MAESKLVLEVAGREVSISNPEKVYFPEAGYTKLDLVRYYHRVAEPTVRSLFGRPVVLKRYVHGITGDFFFQKRAPEKKPSWIETVELSFPSGRTAQEVVIRDAAHLLWTVNLGCIDTNPHPARADDLDHPDELRIDLDPVPGVEWPQIQKVAMVTREVLESVGLIGWPKTSGSRGIHVDVRIERRFSFDQVRRAALAIAREVERRAPDIATSKWWKEERHGVFLDYNQNAKDRTVAGAYSVRPLPDARVSTPLAWDEVLTVDPSAFTIATVPERVDEKGDLRAGIDESVGSLDAVLELSAKQETEGLGDAPWPPHYDKQEGEPPRVQPSRKKKPAAEKKIGRRRSTKPLIEIARAKREADARAGLERWKARHPEVVPHLSPEHVLVDAMRGKYTTWTRIRVNLENVPEALRPPQEELESNYDPWEE